jgi:uncharacterized protein
MTLNLIENILVSAWNTLAEMSPYLLFGFFVAGLLSVFISQKLVERHLGGNGIMPILKASAFGVPLPLCSCGVIPVSMSLHKHGASKGATVSFLLSTPQTGVDSIFVTLSLLGPVFAIFRPLAALITGLVGGILVNLVEHNKDIIPPTKCSDECCDSTKKNEKFTRVFKYGFVTLPRDIGREMLVGLVIAAVISAVVPDGFFAEKLGTGFMAMVIMMLLGIPVYVCATASVPVAAAMILKGLTPGAALVFLMTGPATNAASFVIIWKTLGSRTAIVYLVTVAGCALAAGLIMDLIASYFKINVVSNPGWMLPLSIKYVSAFVLLSILGFALLTRKKTA